MLSSVVHPLPLCHLHELVDFVSIIFLSGLLQVTNTLPSTVHTLVTVMICVLTTGMMSLGLTPI